MSATTPPSSLLEEHENYLTIVGAIVDMREAVIGGIESSDGSESALDQIFNGLPDFESACLPLAARSDFLGLNLQFPCGDEG